MLNLGLESLQVKEEETYTSLEELLQSQLDFNEVYQDFVDYKNVCEIVVKAKASAESMTFASNLLNVSVESIDVSAEGLADKFKVVWDKFVTMWQKFVGWFKGVINKLKPMEFPVLVSPSRDVFKQHIKGLVSAIEQGTLVNAACLSSILDRNEERLDNKEAFNEWRTLCKDYIANLDKLIQNAKELSKSRSGFAKGSNNPDMTHGKFLDPKYVKNVRYCTMFGPKIITKLQQKLTELFQGNKNVSQ